MSLWRPRRFRLWALLFLALMVLAAYFERQPLLQGVGRFLDVSEPPRRTDAVLVLGGGVNDRPFVAAALYRAGLARRVLITTVKPSPDSLDALLPPEDELTRRVLHARGVPDKDIVQLPGSCDGTVDEVRALAEYLDSEPGATVAVVTHAFHTRRARLLFRRILGERASQVHFVAAPHDHFDADDWWQSEEGFRTYAVEYAKLALPWRR